MSSYVNANVGITCIELLPGEPVQVFPRRLPRLPPSNFVDRNDYCFKLVDGQMRLRGIELRPDWENWPVTPDKLSCYREKGEESMSKPTGRPKREAPPKKELLALFEKHEGKVAPIAEELKASWAYAKRWLIDAGIIDSLGNPTSEYNFEWYEPKKKQTLPPKPEQAANQEPEREEKEPAEDIIPKTEMGCPFDEEAFNPDIPEVVEDAFPASAFTIVDEEEPFPYTVTEEKAFNLDTFKMRVLEMFQEVARANQAPAYVSLAFMNAIIDTYPEKGE